MADILLITLPDGTTYNLKDSTAVTNVGWDSTNKKILKTINGTTSDVVSIPIISGTGTNSAVGGNSSNVASGNYSFAFGNIASANATASLAFGYGTKASSLYLTVMGKFNIEDDLNAYALILGNGTADNARSNAITVDWSGNIGANNIVTSTSVSNTGLISFKNSNNTTVYSTLLPIYDGSVTGGSPGSNRYVVTITYDSQNDEYSADKTFAQVLAACEAGKVVLAYIDELGIIISLNFYNDGIIAFGYLDAEAVYLYEFVIGDDETVSVYDVQLQPA